MAKMFFPPVEGHTKEQIARQANYEIDVVREQLEELEELMELHPDNDERVVLRTYSSLPYDDYVTMKHIKDVEVSESMSDSLAQEFVTDTHHIYDDEDYSEKHSRIIWDWIKDYKAVDPTKD